MRIVLANEITESMSVHLAMDKDKELDMKHDVLTQLRDSARALLSRDDHRRRVRSGRDSPLDYSAEL